MKPKSNLFCFLICIFVIASCAAQTNTQPSNYVSDSSFTPAPERNTEPTNNLMPSPQNTVTLQPAFTGTATSTKLPLVLHYQGTALPASKTRITYEDLPQLQQIAQWGKGTIRALAFSPDGTQFIASSDLGYAVYLTENPQAAPIWVPFEIPINHHSITFSEDGTVLRLNVARAKSSVVVDYSTGKLLTGPFEETWAEYLSPTFSPGPGGLNLISPDQTLKFVTSTKYDEENMNIEYSIREIFDNQSGEFLYELSDETFYYEPSMVSYTSGGCDVKLVAACGNGFTPDAYFPYLSAFSADSQWLFVLYENSNSFTFETSGILQIYTANNGKLKNTLENQQPIIKTFAFAPDSHTLLIARTDGSIGLWDLESSKYINQLTDFSGSIRYAALANHGETMLIQTSNNLELRSTLDGSILAKYDINNFLLAPDDDRIMYYTDDHLSIKAMDITSGKIILNIPAHNKSILDYQISADGNYLVTSSTDCTVKLWNARTGSYLHSFQETLANSAWGGPPLEEDEFQNNSRILINDIQFIPGKEQLFGYGSWDVAVNWDFNSGASNYVLYNNTEEREEGSDSVSFHYPSIYHIDEVNNTVSIFQATYDLSSGEYLGHYESDDSLGLSCKMDQSLIIDENFRLAIGKGENLHKLCVIDEEAGQIINTLSLYDPYENLPYIEDFWISPDKSRLYVLTGNDVIDIFEIGK